MVLRNRYVAYEVLDWLKGKKGKVLDAGSGDNTWSNLLVSMGFDVKGCDITPQGKADKVDLNGKLPYKDNTFDFVTAVEVIEHIENPAIMVSEFNRVLKQNGCLLITTPNIVRFSSRLQFLITKHFWCFGQQSQKSGHINPMTHEQLKALLERKGFSEEYSKERHSIFVVAKKTKA